MNSEAARILLAEAIATVLDSGEFRAAHAVSTKVFVDGREEVVSCFLLGATERATAAVAERLTDDAAFAERDAWCRAWTAIEEASTKSGAS
ncbi:hypothetical protein [Paraburkholderia tropica]|uniref:hypothetical protein n=1 Tax=Paraburkholderia tropica TaxID=92647 RepID=UPI002AB7EEB6|nr:hypothetical protein [Paraburkholderia tropica]